MKPKPFSISKHIPVLFLLVFLSFFAHLGSIPLFDADEGAYSEVSREMLANQDFTSILLNGKPFFHKPPLFYWAQATSIRLLGLNEFGLRLPSAIAALLWTVSIFLFARRFYDTETAWHASLFMASSLLVSIVGRAATPEALFNLFLTLTLVNIYKFHHSGNKRHIYWSYMFAALGVLTKGAFALVLPVVVSLVFFGSQRRWRQLLSLFFNPVGLTVFGLIVIPWYIGEFMLHGEQFFSNLFMLPAMTGVTFDFIGSSLPYYSYLVFMLVGLLPFSALFIKAVFHIWKKMDDDLLRYALTWFGITFLLLPLFLPKSIFALACCLPPLFIIMARVVDIFRYSLNLFIGPLLCLVLLLLLPSWAPYVSGSIGNDFAGNVVRNAAVYFDASYHLLLGAAVFLLAVLTISKSVPQSVRHGILGLLFVSLMHFLILPIMGDILQQPVKSAGLLAKKENLQVVTWRMQHPSFNVYAERLTTAHAPKTGDIVLTRSDHLGRDVPHEILFKKHGVLLVRILEKQAEASDVFSGANKPYLK